MQIVSFTETMQFACLPYPGNVRALALYIVYKERPDIVRRYPRFSEEFNKLMAPVMAAIGSGSIEDLYHKYNPNMPKQNTHCPTTGYSGSPINRAPAEPGRYRFQPVIFAWNHGSLALTCRCYPQSLAHGFVGGVACYGSRPDLPIPHGKSAEGPEWWMGSAYNLLGSGELEFGDIF